MRSRGPWAQLPAARALSPRLLQVGKANARGWQRSSLSSIVRRVREERAAFARSFSAVSTG
eukprot:8269505-Pyramimonas_sp.AAC.1